MTQFQYGQQPPTPPGKRPWYLGLWAGIGLGFALFAAWWGLFIVSINVVRDEAALGMTMSALGMGAPIAYLVGAVVLMAIPRTTRLGGGMLIASGVGLLVLAGACFAAFASLG